MHSNADARALGVIIVNAGLCAAPYRRDVRPLPVTLFVYEGTVLVTRSTFRDVGGAPALSEKRPAIIDGVNVYDEETDTTMTYRSWTVKLTASATEGPEPTNPKWISSRDDRVAMAELDAAVREWQAIRTDDQEQMRRMQKSP
jgi:hypothetical protein